MLELNAAGLRGASEEETDGPLSLKQAPTTRSLPPA